jgi:hypothetical protein
MTLTPDPTGRPPRRGPRRAVLALVSLAAAALVVLIGVAANAGSHGEFKPGTGIAPLPSVATAPAVAPDTLQAPTIGDLPLSDEDLYIQVLDGEGIYYSSEQAAVDAGYAVCDYLDAGGSLLDAADIAMSEGGYSPYDAGFIVGTASTALCPGSGR